MLMISCHIKRVSKMQKVDINSSIFPCHWLLLDCLFSLFCGQLQCNRSTALSSGKVVCVCMYILLNFTVLQWMGRTWTFTALLSNVMLLHLPTGLNEEVLPVPCAVGVGRVHSCGLENSCPGPFMRPLTSLIGYLSCCVGCNKRLCSFPISPEKSES